MPDERIENHQGESLREILNMNEQEIFNEALEIDDVPSRSAFLDQVCGDDRLLENRWMHYLKNTRDRENS